MKVYAPTSSTQKSKNNCIFLIDLLNMFEETHDLSARELVFRVLCRDSLSSFVLDRAAHWKERGKFHVVLEGDENTRFFHTRASQRLRRNMICALTSTARSSSRTMPRRRLYTVSTPTSSAMPPPIGGTSTLSPSTRAAPRWTVQHSLGHFWPAKSRARSTPWTALVHRGLMDLGRASTGKPRTQFSLRCCGCLNNSTLAPST
jgi:hypothetical protein